MPTVYTAHITGAPDGLPNWDLTIQTLNIDLTATTGTVEFRSPNEDDYTEALLRPNGFMVVSESIDDEALEELVSVAMLAATQQSLTNQVQAGAAVTLVTLRAQGTVAAWPTVTDEDVSSILAFSQVRGSSKTWRIPFQRQITPGSTVLRGPDQRLTVDRSAINIGGSPPATMSLTMDGTP